MRALYGSHTFMIPTYCPVVPRMIPLGLHIFRHASPGCVVPFVTQHGSWRNIAGWDEQDLPAVTV